MLRRDFVALMTAPLLFAISGCSASEGARDAEQDTDGTSQAQAVTITCGVSEYAKFDSVKLEASLTDLENAGFSLGDSCDIELSDGTSLTDIPIYSGYFVKTGEPLLVVFSAFGGAFLSYNNAPCWSTMNLNDQSTITLTLHEAGKYKKTEDLLASDMSNDRNDYPSDVTFTNFRAMTGGNLKQNFLYRGASPVNQNLNRATVVDGLLQEVGVQCVLDLADSEANFQKDINAESFDSPYTLSLYEQGRVVLMSLSTREASDEFKKPLGQGIQKLLEVGGPAYIHCSFGQDRTGFVAALLEGLAGATYDEMCDDYMQSYANLSGITKDNAEAYDLLVELHFNEFMTIVSGVEDVETLKSLDYTSSARQYLVECGLTEAEVDQLVQLICE
jgi:hypothetical protein